MWTKSLAAQPPLFDAYPEVHPPYYSVRYEASTQPGGLVFAANFTVWIPPDIKSLRGVIVRQHGCSEVSCKSGLSGAFDLHWQALARKHDCALLSPAYEKPDGQDCQLWCDPRNGSSDTFQRSLVDLGNLSGHPELAEVPWALWGHSGGGHWVGGMVLLHPERIAAVWIRSGVPLLEPLSTHPTVKPHTVPEGALEVPIMCNLGATEGVSVKEGRFSFMWPLNEKFFNALRSRGGLIGVAVDPLSGHECGNQRYLAIPWFDACLSARLPAAKGESLRSMSNDQAWLAPLTGGTAVPLAHFAGDSMKAGWLPDEATARAWMDYVRDTGVIDTTPPPAPYNVRLQGNLVTWEAEADFESGIADFLIERDGVLLTSASLPAKEVFGRPTFQQLQYGDTPVQPLVPLSFTDTHQTPGTQHVYRVITVNTVGRRSEPSAASNLVEGP
ncbi:hypothetical protein [Planctomicrobium sp. SH664]|uniref:hypothetical protein n=1 Tax=Planctomicrobium sp. SH664 TaxID=3448125 RepID=UPI003F5BF7F6